MEIKTLKAMTTKRTRLKESWKVKVDKAKGLRKDLERSKIKVEKEVKRRQAKSDKFPALKDSIVKVSFPLHFAAACIIFILFLHLSFLSHFSNSILSFTFRVPLSENLHFETSGIARSIFLYKLKPGIRQRKQKPSPQSLNQERLPRNPETRLTILAKDLHRNTLVPVILQLLGQPRVPEKYPQIDSFQFQYLGPPR